VIRNARHDGHIRDESAYAARVVDGTARAAYAAHIVDGAPRASASRRAPGRSPCTGYAHAGIVVRAAATVAALADRVVVTSKLDVTGASHQRHRRHESPPTELCSCECHLSLPFQPARRALTAFSM
jgi:hypothetical protein